MHQSKPINDGIGCPIVVEPVQGLLLEEVVDFQDHLREAAVAHDGLPVELADQGFDFVGTADEELHLVLIDLYHFRKGGLAIVLVSVVEALEHPDCGSDDLNELSLDPADFT